MKKYTLNIVIIAVLVGAASFFGGMQYQKGQIPQNTRQQRGPSGQNGQGTRVGGGNGGRQVMGEIISQDDKSITVKMQDGSTRIVLVSDTTTVNKEAQGAKSDLQVGQRVGVFGTDNTDGSVVAQSIQLNPTFRGMPGTGTPPAVKK
jgi:hypothetical protein